MSTAWASRHTPPAGGPSCPNAVHPQRPPHLPVRSRHAVPPTTSASAALPSSTATAQLRSLSLVARSTGGHSGWGHQGFVPHQLSSCRHNSSSSGGGSGGSSSSSRNVTARVGGSSALPTPYKWSWSPEEAGDVAGPPLELDAAVLGAAGSVDDLTAALQAAAASAPPRASLTPASRAALARATERALSSDSSTCTTAQAASLLESYGRLTNDAVPMALPEAAAAAASRNSHGDPSAPGLVAVVLGHLLALPHHQHQQQQQHTDPQQPGAGPTAQGQDQGQGGGVGDGQLPSTSARHLADLLWALSELPDSELPWEQQQQQQQQQHAEAPLEGGAGLAAAVAHAAPAALQRAVLRRLQEQDFLAPDLCRAACALGSMASAPASTSSSESSSSTAAAQSAGASAAGAFAASATAAASANIRRSTTGDGPTASATQATASGGSPTTATTSPGCGFVLDKQLLRALSSEVRYQLVEFEGDFEAGDLARLISGLAGMRLGAEIAADEEYRRVLMKAVYGKTRSITDKAEVDFALSRLMTDDPDARSMHYDTRWTHEELHWLPRRERDKRRIIKEGWYRTKWGGWSPGSSN